jgi:GntP family gluconate:H+ symporter
LSGSLTITALLVSIFILVYLTVIVKVHPFFSLILSSFIFSFISRMPTATMLDAFTKGLGDTVSSIGIVIALGTVMGALLERCGAAESMGNFILKITGKRLAALGLAITGYFVSIPVFCDSAFVILSPLARELSIETNTSMTTMAVALAMGLHATHMLVPPTPGPLAVAGILGADLGSVVLAGMIVSIPVTLAGYYIATRMGSKYFYQVKRAEPKAKDDDKKLRLPGALEAFMPILIPIILMVLKTIGDIPSKPFGTGIFLAIIDFIGTPIVALLIGVFLALVTYLEIKKDKKVYSFDGLFGDALKSAGQIALIVGAGGAFGSVLRASALKDILLSYFSTANIGILAPFIIGAVFRSAIGSGTVAMVTAATMLSPLLDALGFAGPMGRLVAMISCAAGGFMVFHGNDDFFWVITSASDMEPSVAYKVLPLASIIQSFTALVFAYIMRLILL